MQISAALASSAVPPPVRVTVTDLPAGAAFRVMGVSESGEWEIPGGVGVSTGDPLVLIDVRAALNQDIHYELRTETDTVSSGPLQVVYPIREPDDEQRVLLQSLDGRASVAPFLLHDEFPVAPEPRITQLAVAGRRTPVSRWDVPTLGASRIRILCTPEESMALQAMLTGAPLVYRAIAPIRDWAPVAVIEVTGVTSTSHTDGDRTWEITFSWSEDPEPSTVLALATWDNFDAAMEGRTWDEFDELFAGRTWADFDVFDWGQA